MRILGEVHYRDLKYLLAYLGPGLVLWGFYTGGYWSFGAFLFAFLVVPAFELLLPESKNQPIPDDQNRAVHIFFDWLLYMNLPIVYVMIFWYAHLINQGELTESELVGHTLGLGVFLGASGINVAHELGHRSKATEIVMAKLLLLPTLYQHFYIEHNRGHHRYVATPQDPATARYGENLYHFWIRSIFGGLKNAWRLEKQRLLRSGVRPYSPSNQMIQFFIMEVAYLLMIYFLFEFFALIMIIIVAVIGFLMLESINYIEHYGLIRKQNRDGRFERVRMIHSWNSNHDAGRILLYELTRHADHHYKASKKYQLLKHIEESPQLPTGYPGSIILAMIPPLWFKVMNHRVPTSMLQS